MNAAAHVPSERAAAPVRMADPAHAFRLLLAKDLRLACPVLIPAAIVLLFVLVVGVVQAMRSNGSLPGEWKSQFQPLGVFLGYLLVIVPGWAAAAMVTGDTGRRGELLLSTLPVPGVVRWWSKGGIVLACMVGLAAANVGVLWWATPHGWSTADGRGTPTELLKNTGLLSALSSVFVASSYAATAVARGLLASMVLSVALPIASTALAFGAGYVAYGACRALAWGVVGFDPLLDGDAPANTFLDPYMGALAPSALATAFLVGTAMAWIGRGRITRSAGPARRAGRMLGITAALLVAGSVVAGPVAALAACGDPAWQERRAANRATADAIAHARALPTPQLLADVLASPSTGPDRGGIAWKQLSQAPCAWEPAPRADAMRGLGRFVRPDPALIAWAERSRERPDECRAAVASAVDRLDAMDVPQRLALASLLGPDAAGTQAIKVLASAADETERLRAMHLLGIQWLMANQRLLDDRATGCMERGAAQSYVALVRTGAVLLCHALRPGMPRPWPQPWQPVSDPRMLALDAATADAARRALELPFPETLERLRAGGRVGIAWVDGVANSATNQDDLACPASELFTVTGPDPWCALPVDGKGASR